MSSQETASSPRKRARIGRGQKIQKPTYQLLRTIRSENALWGILSLLLIFDLIAIEKVLYQVHAANEISQFITQRTAVVIFGMIITRIILNLILSTLIKWGLFWYKNLLNHITTLTNFIFSGISFSIVAFIMGSVNIWLAQNFSRLKIVQQEVFKGENTNGPEHILQLTIFFDVLFILTYILAMSAVIVLLFNLMRSVPAFIRSFDLLPASRKINNEMRISNYHPLDMPAVREMYMNLGQTTDARLTHDDFDKFMKVYDINNFRVLLRNNEPIGFYTTGDNRTVLEQVKIAPEYRNQGLGEILLKDFEISNLRRKPTTLTARFPAEDKKTAEYLSNQGWSETGEAGRSQKTFQKTIQKGQEEPSLVSAPIGETEEQLNNNVKNVLMTEKDAPHNPTTNNEPEAPAVLKKNSRSLPILQQAKEQEATEQKNNNTLKNSDTVDELPELPTKFINPFEKK